MHVEFLCNRYIHRLRHFKGALVNCLYSFFVLICPTGFLNYQSGPTEGSGTMTEPSLFWTLFQTGFCALIGIFCLWGGLAYIRDYLRGSSDLDSFWGATYIVLGCLFITIGCGIAFTDAFKSNVAALAKTYKERPELCKTLVSPSECLPPNQSNGGTK